MIFHENRLLADDSHEIEYHIFIENQKRCFNFCRLQQSRLALQGLIGEFKPDACLWLAPAAHLVVFSNSDCL